RRARNSRLRLAVSPESSPVRAETVFSGSSGGCCARRFAENKRLSRIMARTVAARFIGTSVGGRDCNAANNLRTETIQRSRRTYSEGIAASLALRLKAARRRASTPYVQIVSGIFRSFGLTSYPGIRMLGLYVYPRNRKTAGIAAGHPGSADLAHADFWIAARPRDRARDPADVG